MRRYPIVLVAALAVFALMPSAAGHEDPDDPTAPAQAESFASIQERSAPAPALAAARCENGTAAGFPCSGIDLAAQVTPAELGLSFVSDMWGWTDPTTNRDYAIVGGAEGTVFVDISLPRTPVVLGILPTASATGSEFWRDVKVYADHAFVVSEHTNHGMQVFDLTELRDVDPADAPVVFAETARYTGISSTHNLAINEDTGFAYAVGTSQCSGGLHMIDISTPSAPTFAGCWSGDGYIHDTQCVAYTGPDVDYQNRELCFNANATTSHYVSITDVTDKAAPVRVARVAYLNAGYSHQGWLTPDQRFFLHGDELDELFFGNPTRTRIWDVRDIDNPVLIGTFDNSTTAIDHNIYTKGRLAYASNYTSGLRIYDTAAVATGTLSEVAYFDVYPENDAALFEGTWSNYPYFSRWNIVGVSSMDRGLFVLRVRPDRPPVE